MTGNGSSSGAPGIAPPLVLLIGSGRTGTTWIGRIFDSVPNTVYLHEPDLVVYDPAFPVVPDPDDMPALVPVADRFLDRLAQARPLKAVAARPILKKPYRSRPAHLLRSSMIYGLRGLETVIGPRVQRLRIPDLVSRRRRQGLSTVIKSVTGLARLPIYAAARPEMPIVHVIRHPCAVVASLLRGIRKGKMPRPHLYDRQLRLPPARRHGLDRAAADRLDDLETTAWRWLIMNDWALEACPADARVRVLRYEDMAREPMAQAREMLRWCGLPWTPASEAFLEQSSHGPAAGVRYHGVMRDSRAAAERWREELSESEVARIHDIVHDSRAGRFYFADET
ncbi:MAG: sulfotransferase [Alphaproteobacteria bacterium]|nr:MAG: sulfotransferase [Alphaproteobacteria bacterium]